MIDPEWTRLVNEMVDWLTDWWFLVRFPNPLRGYQDMRGFMMLWVFCICYGLYCWRRDRNLPEPAVVEMVCDEEEETLEVAL